MIVYHSYMRKTEAVKQGVILAAGKGSRIFPLSTNYPKPLLPVLNKPIMQYQIEAMKNLGIKEIVVVVGILGNKIKSFFGNGKKFGVNISYVSDYNPQGIASSLMKARNKITGPFVLFLGDIFVVKADLRSAKRKMEILAADGVIIGKKETDRDLIRRNFSVIFDKNSRVLKVIEKPKNPKSLFKGYGFYLFSPAIFKAIMKTPRSQLRNEYEITDAIQTLIDMGGNVYADEWDNWDFNLSYPKDLIDCNMRMLKEEKLESLLGQGVIVQPDTRIVSSVVGDRSRIGNVYIMECLALPDAEISSSNDLIRRTIFTQDFALSA